MAAAIQNRPGPHGYVFNLEVIDPGVRSALTSRGANPLGSIQPQRRRAAQCTAVNAEDPVLHPALIYFLKPKAQTDVAVVGGRHLSVIFFSAILNLKLDVTDSK